MFKVDFESAYDTVNWNFLDYMMARMGFAEGWMRWIRACVFQSSMSVLVNGSPTEDFRVGKGLRQGDPLSPFLFLFVAEGLTGLMPKAVDSNLFHGYKVSNNILFHTLQFADDTIIVGEANFLYGERREGLKHASIWWRDILNLGSEEEGGWFGNNISSILGDGKDIGFWKEK
ncbi:LINE-1 reverse transcriptase like, partial [Trifolium medium]|nr:LINE-1 reverse transcriptase like [Trifolium medium]